MAVLTNDLIKNIYNGVAGMIGSNQRLTLNDGFNVVGVDNFEKRENIGLLAKPNFTFYELDVATDGWGN